MNLHAYPGCDAMTGKRDAGGGDDARSSFTPVDISACLVDARRAPTLFGAPQSKKMANFASPQRRDRTPGSSTQWLRLRHGLGEQLPHDFGIAFDRQQ